MHLGSQRGAAGGVPVPRPQQHRQPVLPPLVARHRGRHALLPQCKLPLQAMLKGQLMGIPAEGGEHRRGFLLLSAVLHEARHLLAHNVDDDDQDDSPVMAVRGGAGDFRLPARARGYARGHPPLPHLPRHRRLCRLHPHGKHVGACDSNRCDLTLSLHIRLTL
jgi:hypothetical protein